MSDVKTLTDRIDALEIRLASGSLGALVEDVRP